MNSETIALIFWTVLVVCGALTFAAETIWPKAPISASVRAQHIAGNFLLWSVSVLLLSVFVHSSVTVVQALSELHRIGLLYSVGAPTWLAAVIGFLAADFADYVFHRASHRSRVLWLLHAVHHSDRHLDVSTSLRQHPFSLLAALTVRAALVLALGAPLWALALRDVCGVANSHLHHAAIAWSPRAQIWMEQYLAWLIVPPTAHWFHHHPETHNTNSNFGQVLSCWDRLFGTYQSSIHPPELSGLNALQESSWHTVWGMLLSPWRARNIEKL